MTIDMGEVVCLGLDLAWSARNPSGGAVMVDSNLVEARADLKDDESIVAWVGAHLAHGDAAVLAVDAPLCVPNLQGKRLCEKQLGDDWRKYQAGPYPANRERFAPIGIRGEDLVKQLGEAYHILEAAPIETRARGHFVCEVYPHPAHVSLFRRSTILKYKKKAGRSYEECWSGLAEYQALLQGLSVNDPPLHDPNGILNASFEGIRGQRLKELEDRLDAITCAYTAWYLWWHGPAGAHTYGTVADGHIIVPRFPPEPC